MQLFFLDDDPERHAEFIANCGVPRRCVTIETEASAALSTLRMMAKISPRFWDVIFLDHDLGGRHFVDPGDANCGMAVVRAFACWQASGWWLPRPLLWVVHSRNHDAAMQMMDGMKEIGVGPVVYVPFNEMVWPVSWLLELSGEGDVDA